MAAYDTLRAAIDNYIKANGNKEITGTVLNDILNAMVSALGADTRFAGVAVPTTNPGNPEGNVVYFASQAGTYSNFGGIVLPLGIHILVWNGTAWASQTWFSVDNTPTQNSQNLATSGGILQAIVDAVGVERLRAIGAEVTSCSFDGTTKKISFFNSADDTLFQLDATAFVIDGMVSDVKIEDGNLVIQFNTDAGKQDIEIPLTDIFNPANYYTKTAIDELLALYYTKTETDALLTAINNKLADGCLYRGMAEPTTNPPTPTTKVFYIATKAGTYTNFGNIAVTEGITILKYDGSNWSKEQISYSDGVFDISAYNGTSYADLSAALGTNGANIPQNLRKGGMSIKFVQSSDNKYVQYRYMPSDASTVATFTNTSNWQGVDATPTAGSHNLVESGGVDELIVSKNEIDISNLTWNNGAYKDKNNTTVSHGPSSWVDIDLDQGYLYAIRANLERGSLAVGVYDTNNGVTQSIDGLTSRSITFSTYIVYAPTVDSKLFVSSITSKIGNVKLYKIPYSIAVNYLKNEIDSLKNSIVALSGKDTEHDNAIVAINNDINAIEQKLAYGVVTLDSSDWHDGYYKKKNNTTAAFGNASWIDVAVEKNARYIVRTKISGTLAIGIYDGNNRVHSAFEGSEVGSYGNVLSEYSFDIPNVDNCKIFISCILGNKNDVLVRKVSFDTSEILQRTVQNENSIDEIRQEISSNIASPISTSSIKSIGNLDIAKPSFDYNLILVYGQSYAMGTGRVGQTDHIPNTYQLGDSTNCNRDKSISTFHNLDNVAGTQIVTQCTNAFAKLWNTNVGDANFVAAAAGEGGKCIEQLGKTSEYYTNMISAITRMKTLADAESKTIGCIGILFIQGESNYDTSPYTNDKIEYKELVLNLKNDLQNDISTVFGQDKKPVFITYQTGSAWIKGRSMPISMAQFELAEENKDVILGCPSYQMSLGSNDHPNGDGYAMIGEMMAKHLYNAMAFNYRYDNAHPQSFAIKDNSVIVNCYVPVPPLTLNTHTVPLAPNYGFSVYADNTEVTIASVLTNGNTIVLTTNTNLEDKIVEVVYAGRSSSGSPSSGYGNVCDSDFMYESIQTITGVINTYPLTRYPKDINGRSIIGEHIPMMNWLSNFYHNIAFHFVTHYVKAKVGETSFSNKIVNTKNLEITYASSDTGVATVASDGSLTLISAGNTKITATVTSNGVSWSDSYLLEVESV